MGHWLGGAVEMGQARGRQLGFPTANLQVEQRFLQDLEQGVYAAWARWDQEGPKQALVNLGVRPTFGAGALALETHILDFSGDLYGKDLEIQLVERLRPERAFSGVEALRQQIALDIKKTRAVLAGQR
ncbi:MAG: hypothetical protein GKR89_09450 [Candidatus Latescibacteria bacterium]|nr:hypothetical protein [Candidatus Latescibacterota bacterium]